MCRQAKGAVQHVHPPAVQVGMHLRLRCIVIQVLHCLHHRMQQWISCQGKARTWQCSTCHAALKLHRCGCAARTMRPHAAPASKLHAPGACARHRPARCGAGQHAQRALHGAPVPRPAAPSPAGLQCGPHLCPPGTPVAGHSGEGLGWGWFVYTGGALGLMGGGWGAGLGVSKSPLGTPVVGLEVGTGGA